MVCKAVLQGAKKEMGISVFMRWYFCLHLRNSRIDRHNLTRENKFFFDADYMHLYSNSSMQTDLFIITEPLKNMFTSIL